MKILFIVGSMRKTSFNRQMANEAKLLIGDQAEVSYLDYSNIPYMNQDLEADLPEYIAYVKEQVRDSDGVWIFTPEYNGMIPGVLKNLLDWLSRPWIPFDYSSGSPVRGKPVTFSGVGGGNKTQGCRAMLDTLLKRIGMKVMSEPSCGFGVTPAIMKSDNWEMSKEEIDELKKQAEAFLKFIKENS